MFFTKLKKEVRNLKRLEEIAKVFAKYGLGYLVQKLPFHPFAVKHPSEKDIVNLPLSVRFRRVLEDLGPTFIKLGQMLSMHPDIIPYEFCREFEKLQDNVPVVEFNKIKGVLEKEFKKPLDKIFKHFPEKAFASASLAQIYEVKLNHEEVIVKVQKPDLRQTIKADLEILEFLANLIEKHFKEAKAYNPKGLLEEFRTYILNELDFASEVVNIERFRRNFKDDKRIYFPSVHKKLCTDKVLVIEKVKGVKINDLKKIQDMGLNRKAIAKTVIDCILKQIFVDGFFHADPHPGNIFILKTGEVSFVDFGIVGRIDEDSKFKLINILIAAAEKDTARIIDIFRDLGALGYVDEKKLKLSLEQMLDKYYGISLKEFRMDDFLKDLTKFMYENKIRILSDHFLLFKTLAMLESMGKTLDPEVNMIKEIKGLLNTVVKQQYSTARIAKKIRQMSRDAFSLVQNFPKDTLSILNEIKNGNLRIGFEHRNLENLIRVLDKFSDRMSFSLIIAALIIGSSVLIHANIQTIFGASFHLGVIGFILAGILGFWLLVNILRSGKL